MEKEEILKTLQYFGLSEYESRVYVALVSLGPAKAGSISREAGVPQSKVYDILEGLIGKQLVEVFEGRPKEFKAIAPEIVLKTFVKEKEEEFKSLRERVFAISALLKPAINKEDTIEGIWVQKGEKWAEVLNRLSEMMERCEKYAYGITRDFSYSARMREAMKNCVRRKVKLKIIGMVQIDESNYSRAKWYYANKIPIRIFETKVHPRIFVVDGKEVSIRLDHNPLQKKKFTFHSIWSQDPSLVKVFDDYMKNLWQSAKPVDFKKIPVPPALT
jgi:sugar-specific transcriptional regulator TrmB